MAAVFRQLIFLYKSFCSKVFWCKFHSFTHSDAYACEL